MKKLCPIEEKPENSLLGVAECRPSASDDVVFVISQFQRLVKPNGDWHRTFACPLQVFKKIHFKSLLPQVSNSMQSYWLYLMETSYFAEFLVATLA